MSEVKSIAAIATPRADLLATGLSALCVIHCLGLPIMSALLPVFASWAEAEWVHKLFVLLALPISVPAILKRSRTTQTPALIATATAGLALLLTGAFVEALHHMEDLITVSGALLLGMAHLIWWRRHRIASVSLQKDL